MKVQQRKRRTGPAAAVLLVSAQLGALSCGGGLTDVDDDADGFTEDQGDCDDMDQTMRIPEDLGSRTDGPGQPFRSTWATGAERPA